MDKQKRFFPSIARSFISFLLAVAMTFSPVWVRFSPIHAEGEVGVQNQDILSEETSPIEGENAQIFEEQVAETAAGDPAAINLNTGADSTNVSQTDITNNTEISNQNEAEVLNEAFLRADTGRNNASYNTGSGVITTQDAKGKGELMNVINRNVVDLPANGGVGPISAGNENTGTNSVNDAFVNINNQLVVKNINESNTVNFLTADVNSGLNSADRNTGHGIILTGDADLGLNFFTLANTNLVGSQKFYAGWQNIYDDWTGNLDLSAEAAANLSPLSQLIIDASNESTGSGSINQAIVDVNDEISVTNINSGNIHNRIDADVVSGKNKTNYNTGTGSVASGNVNSAINIVNFLNSNVTSSNWWLKTLNVFGNWTGDILLPKMARPNLQIGGSAEIESVNEQTGADSQNVADVNMENSFTIDNSNEAVITNNVNVRSDTGNNKTSYNGGSGIVKFGEADAETNEINVANLNVTGDSWWLVVVNKFGNWSGTTIGSPEDMIVSSNANTTVLVPAGSGIKVGNNSTGPDSNNIAGANINHSTDITNSNTATILNELDLDAISGENEAQYNTGHGYIDTGDVRVVNNLINFANANIAVGNWLVATINVFGDWQGNVVFSTPETITDQNGSTGGLDTNISTNQDTGSGSSNNASTDSASNNNIANNNNANTANNTAASSLTGENSASYNTGSGVITTGAATVDSSIGNQINNNVVDLGGVAGGNSSIASNGQTGSGSDNNSSVSNTSNNNVVNNNNIDADNNFSIVNSTGQNSANYNTGSGIVDTSWADTYLGLFNQYNENETKTMSDLAEDFSDPDLSPDDNSNGSNDNSTAETTPETATPSQDSGNGGGGTLGQIVSPVLSGGGGGFSSVLETLKRGDLNGDGKIDDFDFSILMANWGDIFENMKADINQDNKVNDFDFSIVMGNWSSVLAVETENN